MAFLLRRSNLLISATFTSFFSRNLSSSLRRNIHTSFKMSKEQIEELQTNPYFNKYADKIAKLQKTSPEEFLNRLATAEEKKKDLKLEQRDEFEKDFSLPTKPKSDVTAGASSQMMKKKTLNERMKLELLQNKSKEEISTIWCEYHKDKDAVCAVIPKDIFAQMSNRFKQFKTFLFPLPRKQGYEFIVVQFDGDEAHFTSLINFQAFRENAPECLTLVHYKELADEKDIVLMVGEYDKNVLTMGEARSLCAQTLLYYGFTDDKRSKLVQRFHLHTDEFNHLDLIAELEATANDPRNYFKKG